MRLVSRPFSLGTGFARTKNDRPTFLKKRSKKLLLRQARADRSSATAIKSFLVLFFKKEHFSFFCLKD
jgi:hypothetical protein